MGIPSWDAWHAQHTDRRIKSLIQWRIWIGWWILPSSMNIGAAIIPISPPPPWIATASTGSSIPKLRIILKIDIWVHLGGNTDGVRTILTLKGRHKPLQQSRQLMQSPKDSMHYIQHKLRPFLWKTCDIQKTWGTRYCSNTYETSIYYF